MPKLKILISYHPSFSKAVEVQMVPRTAEGSTVYCDTRPGYETVNFKNPGDLDFSVQ
tara:strand:- start:2144 stop:2314 length:171 start_codon:yes stop_codon:yes gene_type:complete